MLKPLRFLILALLVLTLYGAVLYQYAPSDLTQGQWLMKPGMLFLFGRIFSLFALYRMARFLFFSSGQSFGTRILSALVAFPAYIFLTFLIMFSINGYYDKHTDTSLWQTNLIQFKSLGLACVVVGIDDAELHYKNVTADMVFVPGKFCHALSRDTIAPDHLTPYSIEFSSGALSISYATDIKKR